MNRTEDPNVTEATLLDGARVARDVLDGARGKVARLQEQKNVTPRLATLLVGGDPASAT